MLITRRTLLAVVAAPAVPALAEELPTSLASLVSERSFGSLAAKEVVTEFFSLTCTHCAAFSRETMPEVTEKLIKPGTLRVVYRDFPLDQVALLTAMVARALPVERYEPFISVLFASQDRWAFARGADPMEEVWKRAALVGMSRPTFDAVIKNDALLQAILDQQQADATRYHVDSTPTFLVNGRNYAGQMSYADFTKSLSLG